MSDDVRSELPASEDPSDVAARLIESFLAGLASVGMEPANAAKLMIMQDAVRLDELADLEAMQRWINREVADWQEADEDEDDGDEAAVPGNAIQH
jgi:hypothetical protein